MSTLIQSPAQPNEQPQEAPAETLRRMIMGFRTTQIIHVVAKLGIADLLREGARGAEDLAPSCAADAGTLYRLLRAAASLGVFLESDDARFGLTPLGEELLTHPHGSLRDIALLYGEDWLWRAYGALAHSVRSGEAAFGHVHGVGIFDYLERDAAACAVFDRSMSAFTANEIAALLAAYDFSRCTSVIDVGGGHGALIAALAKAHPALTGVVYDRAPLMQGAQQRWRDEGVAQRCHFIAGDFFRAAPKGGDLYILKRVIHDWDDADAEAILRNCRRVMPGGGTLLLMERVIPPGGGASEAKLFDINMLVSAGGRERTQAEYARLFAQAGFTLAHVHATRSQLSILEARAT